MLPRSSKVSTKFAIGQHCGWQPRSLSHSRRKGCERRTVQYEGAVRKSERSGATDVLVDCFVGSEILKCQEQWSYNYLTVCECDRPFTVRPPRLGTQKNIGAEESVSTVTMCRAYRDGIFGKQFFEEICRRDLEGIVAKRKLGIYKDDGNTWLKIKNKNYSQAEGKLLTQRR